MDAATGFVIGQGWSREIRCCLGHLRKLRFLPTLLPNQGQHKYHYPYGYLINSKFSRDQIG